MARLPGESVRRDVQHPRKPEATVPSGPRVPALHLLPRSHLAAAARKQSAAKTAGETNGPVNHKIPGQRERTRMEDFSEVLARCGWLEKKQPAHKGASLR